MTSADTERRLNNMIRIGIISDVDTLNAVCNIRTGNNEIIERQWIALRAGTTRDWNPPTVGEQVVLLCPCGDLSQAIVLPGLYYNENPAPSQNPNDKKTVYPDGSDISYNHETHHLDVTLCQGATINIKAPSKITITSSDTEITTKLKVIGDTEIIGKLSVTKKTTLSDDVDVGKALTATGEVTGNGIALSAHIHPTTAEGAPTGQPQ